MRPFPTVHVPVNDAADARSTRRAARALVRLVGAITLALAVTGAGSPLHPQQRTEASDSLAAAERAGRRAAERPAVAAHFLGGVTSGAAIGAAPLFPPAGGMGVLGLISVHSLVEPNEIPADAVPAEVSPELRGAFEAAYRERLADRRRSATWWGTGVGIAVGLAILSTVIPAT